MNDLGLFQQVPPTNSLQNGENGVGPPSMYCMCPRRSMKTWKPRARGLATDWRKEALFTMSQRIKVRTRDLQTFASAPAGWYSNGTVRIDAHVLQVD